MTTLFTSTDIATAAPIEALKRRKRLGWLPLLTVLFCVSYALMTMLIVEQGATIESQRALIKELFRDSSELSATKLKAAQEQRAAQARSQAGKSQSPVTQAPSSQTPSTQAPQNQTPSSQVPQSRAQQPKHFEVPPRPASDLSDDRRALIKI